MEVIICESAAEVASMVATFMCDMVRSNPSAVLGLPTGKSPIRTYHTLIMLAAQEGVDFSRVRVFMLDEYLGIDDDHPSRFFNVLTGFTDDLGIARSSIVALPHAWPDVEEPDVELSRRCQEYEQSIRDLGGIDLQLLGISAHGHIAFNEPMSSLASRTRVKTLTQSTRRANAESFPVIDVVGDDFSDLQFRMAPGSGEVPVHVITQGVATILDSRHAILIATGEAKADIVAQAVEGPLTSFVPASALQLHPHATVVLDEDAAKNLAMADYYREVRENKRYIQRPIT